MNHTLPQDLAIKTVAFQDCSFILPSKHSKYSCSHQEQLGLKRIPLKIPGKLLNRPISNTLFTVLSIKIKCPRLVASSQFTLKGILKCYFSVHPSQLDHIYSKRKKLLGLKTSLRSTLSIKAAVKNKPLEHNFSKAKQVLNILSLLELRLDFIPFPCYLHQNYVQSRKYILTSSFLKENTHSPP